MVLDFLNQNSGAFSLIFSCIVTIATVIYAILTWRLVTETRQMREAQTEPIISVILIHRDEWIGWIGMLIKNIGPGPAKNISFHIDRDFEYGKGEFLSQLALMKKGLSYLAPNQEIKFMLTSMAEDYEKKINNIFEIRVNYENSLGKPYEKSFIYDISEFEGLAQFGTPPLFKIAENIKKIESNLSRLCSGFNKLKVISYSKSDVEAEYAERGAIQRERVDQQSKEDKK